MIDNSNKKLKSLSSYLHLFDFSQLNQKSIILNQKGDVFYTLRAIKKIVSETLNQTKKIANQLKSNDLEQTLRNNWNFVYEHIAYKLDDEQVEQIRTPLRLVFDKKGDCDCFTTFLSSVLTNQNIPHSLRMTEYENKGFFQHVYIIVPTKNGHYTLDCVVDKFNKEVPFTKKYDMQIAMLNGLSGGSSLGFGQEFSTMNGLGSLALDNPQTATPSQMEQDFLNRLKSHLISTVNILSSLPRPSVEQITFKKQAEYVISQWDNESTRNAALEQVAKTEENLNGFSLKKTWSSIKQGAQNVKTAVVTTVQKAGDKIGDAAKKVAEVAKDVGQAIVKYNPLSIAIRNGFLLAVSTNIFNLGGYLGWGYVTDEQAKQYGLNASELAKARERHQRAYKIYVDTLQGDPASFRRAVKDGFNISMSKRKSPIRLSGLGEPVTGAAVATASAFIAKVMSFLKEIDFPKLLANVNGAKEFIDSFKSQETKEEISSDPVQMEQQVQQYFGDGGLSEEEQKIVDEIERKKAEEEKKKANQKMLMIGGGILLVGGFLYMNSKKSSSLNGTPKKRTKKGTQTPTIKKATVKKPTRKKATVKKVKMTI